MPSTRSKTKSKKSSTNKKKPYIRMAFAAILHTKHGGKGVSRQKIASYIKSNFDSVAEGSAFNTALRKALKDGMLRGVLTAGSSSQRYKILPLGRREEKENDLSKKYDAVEEEKIERKTKRAAKRAAEKKKKAKAEKKAEAAKKKKKAEAAAKKKRKAAAAKKKKRGRPKRASSRRTRSSS